MTVSVRSRTGVFFAFALAGWTLFFAACQPRRTDPEEALRTFLSDLRNGRAEPAWAALTTTSQKDIERRHAALRGADGPPPKPAQLLSEALGLMLVSAPESIAVASPPGEDVMLRVSVKDGRSADIRMVREGDRWKVDLIGSLHPAPPLDERLGQKTTTETSTSP